MNWLKNNKWLIVFSLSLIVLIVFIVLIIKHIRKMGTQNLNNNNVQAFLKMIRYAEGTSGVNGYKTLFGGKLFNDYSKHPNVKVPFFNRATGKQDYSTAAGAYQFLYKTWIALQVKLGLPDFSPNSQDLAAIEKIRERGALDLVIAGKFEQAVQKVSKEWASMPGAGYAQPEKKIAQLKQVYLQNGGQLA